MSMNRKTGSFAVVLIVLALMTGGIEDAQARRLGGGGSFGSRPSYSQPFQRNSSANTANQPQRSPAQQQATIQNQAARQIFANRGGLMGMLGGLALGGLLGALFFGGAFENFNAFDILVIVGMVYLLSRLLAGKTIRHQTQTAANAWQRSSQQQGIGQFEADSKPQSRAFTTDLLFNKNKLSSLPAGFDQSAFLAGAERAFRHLQAAWDKRDLAGIRELTTDKVFAELQDQLKASHAINKTEVLDLRSELLEIHDEGSELAAAVLFSSLIREDHGEAQEVREVWHFTRPTGSRQPKWFLDGIQQVAD